VRFTRASLPVRVEQPVISTREGFMAKIIVLFNLKPGVNAADYEAFARGSSPYQYIEVIDVNSMEQLGADVSTETMQKVAATFRGMAENPLFIVTRNL
jgi:hypothetical protein